jgi:putative transcriptional regulator
VKTKHHLDDATIVAYAAGTLPEAHMVVVAAHMAYCSQCRDAVRAAEAIGGNLLTETEEKPVSATCREATMASLGAMLAQPAKLVVRADSDVPSVLSKLIGGQSLDSLTWKKKTPGVAKFDIPLGDGAKSHLQLLRIGPGREMPDHGHGGEEITLILRGSYSDHTGQYSRGDVADLDEEIEHRPKVDSSEDCICLIATEAPTKFRSFWARLAQPYLGI